jgi:putative endonuclease
MQTSSGWSLYIIRCKDRSLYVGITTDVDRRFQEHLSQGKRCAKYLRGRKPLALVYQADVGTKAQALRLEYTLKQLPKAKKEAFLHGNVVLGQR